MNPGHFKFGLVCGDLDQPLHIPSGANGNNNVWDVDTQNVGSFLVQPQSINGPTERG